MRAAGVQCVPSPRHTQPKAQEEDIHVIRGRVRNSGKNVAGVRRNRPSRCKRFVAKLKAEPEVKAEAKDTAATPQQPPPTPPQLRPPPPPLPAPTTQQLYVTRLLSFGFQAAVMAFRIGDMDPWHNGSVQAAEDRAVQAMRLSLIHISEPTRPY